MGKSRGRNERERMSQYFRSWCSAFPVAAGVSPAISSRVTFSLDLHDFRGASILKRKPVAHVHGEERFAYRRNPTDGVRVEIEFVNTDDGIGFGPTFFIFYRHRCAEGNAVRCRVRRIDNVDRCQNLFQFGHALTVPVCCAKFLQFVAQMLRAARGDVIRRARGQSRRRSLPSASLRKIDIFFDERPAHSKEYRTIVSFSVSDFAQPLSNSLLSLPAVVDERLRSLDAAPVFGVPRVRREPGIWQNSRSMIADLAQP